MTAEHRRPDGTLMQGYYCPKCGVGGLGMMGHDQTKCVADPELVAKLWHANGVLGHAPFGAPPGERPEEGDDDPISDGDPE